MNVNPYVTQLLNVSEADAKTLCQVENKNKEGINLFTDLKAVSW